MVRRVNPTRLVKRKIPSMCRPPPRPPGMQNSLNDKARKRVLPNIDPKGRPLTKSPDIHYANEERVNYVKVQNGWLLQNGWLGVDPVPNDPMPHS